MTPALNSPLRHWASDEDGARVAAQKRLNTSLDRLRSLGIDARGEIGDGEPLQAMEDALRLFGADEIIISTHPEGRSHWLEKKVVESARERFAVPITHVVVDLEAEPKRSRSRPRRRDEADSLLKLFRRSERPQTEADKAHDRMWDARTNDMVDGKGLSPTGAVMDFESDSKRSP